MRRKKMSRRRSRRSFARGASKTNGLNLMAKPMRGGFRI